MKEPNFQPIDPATFERLDASLSNAQRAIAALDRAILLKTMCTEARYYAKNARALMYSAIADHEREVSDLKARLDVLARDMDKL